MVVPSFSDAISHGRPSCGLYVCGALGVALAATYPLVEGFSPGVVPRAFIVVSLSLVIVHTGWEVHRRELVADRGWRVLGGALLGVVAFALLVGAIVLVRWVEGIPLRDTPFTLLVAGVVGGAVGGRVSLYATRLEMELRENRELTKLLRVNQRVLRHNVRNELTIALGYLENVEERHPESAAELDTVQKHLYELLETSHEARQVVSIWETDDDTTFRLAELLENCVERCERRHGVAVEVCCPADAVVRAHTSLPTAVDEVLDNAVRHNPGVDVRIDGTLTGDEAVVAVTDTGSGIPDVETEPLFEPEETDLRHGRGLGLWTVYWTVRESDGDLAFRDNEPQGTVVELRLPLTDA